jgi:hypothetical protein
MYQQIRTVLYFGDLLPAFAFAQSADERRGQGYVFIAPGGIAPNGSTVTLQLGVGGEGLIHRGLGGGGEVGYLTSTRSLGSGFGILSANTSYHFTKASASGKVVPFVTGGYSLFFGDGQANGFNAGGGVTCWFRERLGLRLEFRDQVVTEGRAVHYLGFRVGLSFR